MVRSGTLQGQLVTGVAAVEPAAEHQGRATAQLATAEMVRKVAQEAAVAMGEMEVRAAMAQEER